MKRLFATLLTLVLLVAVLPINTQAAKVSITYKKIHMITGETFYDLYLKHSLVKSAKSSNKKVCTIDDYCYIKAKKAGTSTITLKDYKNKSYKCKVTVYDKKAIEDSLELKRITYKNDDGIETYYLLTNNSPIALDIDIDVSGKKVTGDIEASDDGCYGIPPKGKYIIYAGFNCSSASFKFKVSTTNRKDHTSSVTMNIKKQTEDALVTIKNSSKSSLSFNGYIIGYDNNGNVISVDRYYTYLDANSTEQSNIYYPGKEVKVYDEDGDWDYEYKYNIPSRYDTYFYAVE